MTAVMLAVTLDVRYQIKQSNKVSLYLLCGGELDAYNDNKWDYVETIVVKIE